MAQSSPIEWTDATWNPVTGCTKVSPGCKNCYALRMAKRLHAMGQQRYRNEFGVTIQPDLLSQPSRWKTPRRIFVNSMSDLFHDAVPLQYIRRVFEEMTAAHWHTFQILTKRAKRMRELSVELKWPSNVWIGVSIETSDYTSRIQHLRAVPAAVRFLSIEPLLGPLGRYSLKGIDWVIVGGESGPRARTMSPGWVRAIRDRCVRQGVPFFFKQWGGTRKKRTGRELDGRTWDEMPIPKHRIARTRTLTGEQSNKALHADRQNVPRFGSLRVSRSEGG
ncbi:MAG: phage Gp37/Gp68 family protein [Gammaproteobacteria bacterium]|nr:phage Gp37/Gp68 family protein [Gammaproteobacteria bacterium]MDJ0891798.1 phage Gp37/Gp68 family protein [Gammaproteobacteria bacterium]